MYEIMELDTTQQKMKKILQIMTDLKIRQLSINDLERIYLTLVGAIDVTSYNADLFKDVAKTMFIINHYYDIKNSNMLLLEGLHLCKLNVLNNSDFVKRINVCIDIVGNFEITSELIQAVTNIVLLADCYLTTMENIRITKKTFWQFLNTSVGTNSFKNSSFYLSISAFLDDYPNKELDDLFYNAAILLEKPYVFLNYEAFINWCVQNFNK